MNLTLILGLLLALSMLGNVGLGKLYVSAKGEAAAAIQAKDSFIAEQKALGDEAKAKAEATKAAQATVTKEITANAKKDRDRLTAFYERRLLDSANDSANSGRLSSTPGAPGGTPAAAAEQVASGPGFELACARDAQQVMQFQDWALKQGIPIAP